MWFGLRRVTKGMEAGGRGSRYNSGWGKPGRSAWLRHQKKVPIIKILGAREIKKLEESKRNLQKVKRGKRGKMGNDDLSPS